MHTDPMRERKLALLLADLTGYTRAANEIAALDLATFLDRYYRLCAESVARHDGRVIKFMGDACFAVFPEDRSVAAVDCALDLGKGVTKLPFPAAMCSSRVGTNIHLATVAEGEIGPEDDRRYDVVGAGVNHLFRMGGGAGIRISEPVYRKLPNERRSPWHKQKPPATYALGR